MSPSLRQTLARSTLGVAALLLTVTVPAATATFEARRYLFLEPALLTSFQDLQITINPAQRHEVVLRPDRPWESLMFGFYSSVLQEDDRVRLWYHARAKQGRPSAGLAYAESRDGIHFTKPALGLVEYEGSKETNLLKGGSAGFTPFIDPNAASPAERYVAVSNLNFPYGGVGRFTSPDGLRWQADEPGFLKFPSDTQNVAFWDQRIGKYVLYFRGWSPQYRTVKRLEVSSLKEPTGIEPTGRGRGSGKPDSLRYALDEVPTVFECDGRDPSRTDVYTMVAQPYPLDPSWYVAFPAFFRRKDGSPTANYQGQKHGPVGTEFAGSRDGIHWHRYDRMPYASPMVASPEDRRMIYMTSGMVVKGDEIWQYANEFESQHGDEPARELKQDGVIVRFVQRVDGFVSLTAANVEGAARTVPVRVTGDRLLLNVDTGALGEIRIGLLDEAGRALPGFSVEDCPPLQKNTIGALVAWPQGNLATLKGRSVCLEIRMRRTKLYSFRFE